MEGEVHMIGKVKIKKVSKSTGQEEVIFEDENQLTEGIKHAVVNVLTGTGSQDINDYKFSYYQLGNQKYDLSTYDISADVTSSALKSYFWTLKSPLTISQYGRDSIFGVAPKDTYVMGSIYPSGTGTTKVIDNFVQPPDARTVRNEYSNTFALAPLGYTPGKSGTLLLSSIYVAGCADIWVGRPENYGVAPMSSLQDYSMSGPDFAAPTWRMAYTPERYLETSLGKTAFAATCIRAHFGYVYNGNTAEHQKGEEMVIFSKLRKNQTLSNYYAGVHYTSGSPELPSTTLTGRVQIFNRFAMNLIATHAGQNRNTFLYRYDYDNVNVTYTPRILDVSSGWEQYAAAKGDASAVQEFKDVYGFPNNAAESKAEYGVVSGNIYNKYGAVYTYADHLNSYSSETGPGASYMDTPNVGFGPSGNFYRASVSWVSASDNMINNYHAYANGTELVGQGLVPFTYPVVSSVKEIDGTDVVGEYVIEKIPRSAAYIGFQQWDYNAEPQANQHVHGEASYYLTYPQDFVDIPDEYTTNHLDNITNVRLVVDEALANSQTIREVGLFLKNPSGATGRDAPFLAAYKFLPCDISKTSEFSYIIDWELSFMDTSVSYTEQSGASEGCTSS